jgi:hypothetical protein
VFTSVAFKSCVVQPLAAAVADAPVTVFGDEAEDGTDEDDEDAAVPDVPDEEPVAADEEEAVPDAGAEDDDDPPDEHPAAAATTAPTATAPPSLTINEAEPNMISHPFYERKVRFLALSTPL